MIELFIGVVFVGVVLRLIKRHNNNLRQQALKNLR
jgi:hypothetical protein